MRVAVVAACPFPFPRGTPTRVLRISEALARRGHDVHVLTYHLGDGSAPEGVRVSRIRDVPFARRTAPGPGPGKLLILDPLLTALVRGTLRAERPDVVYAHHYEGLLAARLGRPTRRTPIVYDAHTTLASELPYSGMVPSGSLGRRLGAALDRRLVPLADAVVAVSDELAGELRTLPGVPAERVRGVPSGVEVERFPPRGPDSGAVRPGPGPTLVYAGNLAEYQGIGALLRAFALIAGRRPGTLLEIATAYETSLAPYDGLVTELGLEGRVRHVTVGFDELPARLAASRVALHPRPPCAGTPLKLLNYMAAALPIVSFRGSAKELDHERTGLLVPDGDIAGFAAAVERLLDDRALAARLGAAARALVERRFSWDAAAASVEEVFGQAIAG